MLELKALLSKDELPAHSDPHMVYALVGILPIAKRRQLPVNLNFVIDAAVMDSDSDGSLNFPAVLSDLIASVDADSNFSVTIIKDAAKVYLSSGNVGENGHRINTSFTSAILALRDGKSLSALNPQALLEGLSLALDQGGKSATSNRINRLVVLLKRSVRCSSDSEALPLVEFAKKIRKEKGASLAPFGIVAYGVGPLINENLLADLSDLSAGRYRYLSDISALGSRLKADVDYLSKARACDLTVELTAYKGVQVYRAHTVGDGVRLLYDRKLRAHASLEESDGPLKLQLSLGEVESKAVCALLLELLAPSRPPGKVRLGLCRAEGYIPYLGGCDESVDLVVNYKEQPKKKDLVLPLKKAVAQTAALRAFQQAEVLLFGGDSERGLSLLQSSAEIMQHAGEQEVAEKVKRVISTIRSAGREEWRKATANENVTTSLDLKSLRDVLFFARSEMINSGLREIP